MNARNEQLQMLYGALHDKMLKVAYRMVGNIESAEDLVQDTFLLALFRQEDLLRHPLPEGWLMRTLHNLALNERRYLARHPSVPLDTLLHIPEEPQAASLDEMLPKELSEQDRKILIWRFEENLDYNEIADCLGISPVSCRSRVSRAVSRCRRYLGEGTASGLKF